MKKYIFIIVNYNGSLITIECIESILNIKSDRIEKIIVVDNNSTIGDVNILLEYEKQYSQTVILDYIFEDTNLGYFGALNKGLKTIQCKKDYFIIVGNNDLLFCDDFCNSFELLNLKSTDYVISPDIINLNNVHQNPTALKCLSPFRKFIYKVSYINYFIFFILISIARIFGKSKELKNREGWDKEQHVYLGFGACYILTPSFFAKNNELLNLVFLNGEEAILAYQVRSSGGKILYSPKVVVKHKDHVTFKKNSQKKNFLITKKSYRIYKKYI